MKVKININNFVNRVIESINTLSEDKICPNCDTEIEIDYETERSISCLDIGFEIILRYIKDIAKRAIKIDDPIILEALLNLEAIKCSADEEAEIMQKVAEINRGQPFESEISEMSETITAGMVEL